jgi:hypothetical protein
MPEAFEVRQQEEETATAKWKLGYRLDASK